MEPISWISNTAEEPIVERLGERIPLRTFDWVSNRYLKCSGIRQAHVYNFNQRLTVR